MSFPAYTRRTLLTNLIRTAACGAIGSRVLGTLAQSSFGGGRRAGIGAMQEEFRRQFRVPAMSVAFSQNGRFVYDRAGGMADRQHVAQATQSSLFRIADLSKPITAVTIFSLIEAGKLTLDGKVFGPGGILEGQFTKIHYRLR